MSDARTSNYIATVWPMVGASGICIILRMLARYRKGTPLWWDDMLMLLGWACLAAGASSIQMSTTRGLGRHVPDIIAADNDNDAGDDLIVILFHGTVIAPALTIAASVFSKISFGLLLLRISSTGCTEITRRIIWGVIGSLSALLLVAVVMLLATCRPIEKTWRPDMEGECLSITARVVGAQIVAAFSGVTDIVLSILPWNIIMCLPIGKKEKASIGVVMSLGFLSGIASFIKCAQIQLMIEPDFSYTAWMLCFWSFFEPTLTMLVACMPIFRVFVRDHRRQIKQPSLQGSAVSCEGYSLPGPSPTRVSYQ